MKYKKRRKFKMRNGMIVLEYKTTMFDVTYKFGYPCDVVAFSNLGTYSNGDKVPRWAYICLLYGIDKENPLPRGGAHGPGFDIIEELK